MPKEWDKNALLRKRQIEEKIDITFCDIFLPFFKEVVYELSPKNIFELGAGTGHLAFNLYDQVQDIYAIEPSQGMFEVARDVLKDTKIQIEKKTIQEINALTSYSLVISNMCFHAIDDVATAIQKVYDLTAVGGCFAFSIPHPCFYNSYKQFIKDTEYSYMTNLKKMVSFTISNDPSNQIADVHYNHRPLEYYFQILIDTGFKLKKFKEVFPTDEIQSKYPNKWENPRYCVFVMVK